MEAIGEEEVDKRGRVAAQDARDYHVMETGITA